MIRLKDCRRYCEHPDDRHWPKADCRLSVAKAGNAAVHVEVGSAAAFISSQPFHNRRHVSRKQPFAKVAPSLIQADSISAFALGAQINGYRCLQLIVER